MHFNRGAIASQAFVKRFPGLTLGEAGVPAYEWLARDLLPALLDFIGQANDAKLMHNKFMVLSKDGEPISVWTGSSNFSRNALHGRLNVGHVIRDAALAKHFLGYWTALQGDPAADALKSWVEASSPLPPSDESDALTPIFSPHRGRSMSRAGQT